MLHHRSKLATYCSETALTPLHF